VKTLIDETNDKLKVILNDLGSEKADIEDSLVKIQDKIDEKIEEAKTYKISVDNAKQTISDLEGDISSLEDDLKDLESRFSNKNLNAILETGNKEINAKILENQKAIGKQKDKIAELTEKARMIKDLLISLKKDKESKKSKLDNITSVYEYYERELSRIITFADTNPDTLNEETVIDNSTFNDNVNSYDKKIVDDKPIFDAIEAIEHDSFTEDNNIEENNEEDSLNVSENVVDDKKEEVDPEFNMFADSNNLDEEKNDTNAPFDFKTLNDSIDKEYASIFGSSDDINVNQGVVEENSLPNPDNLFGFNEFDGKIFDTSVFKPLDEKSESDEVSDFFNKNNLSFDKFSKDVQDKLRKNFDLVAFTKTLDILRKNNLKLEYLYNASDIFDISHNELETIITKLLLAGQSTQNISYVLNALPLINSMDLQDVIDSYGASIKDANITDIIIKAKHLKELGGGNI
jgi:hypothetical protein